MFQNLKEHLEKPLLLSRPLVSKDLFLYLAVSEHAVSSSLIQEENQLQLLVYYVSKRLQRVETRYTDMKKLAYALLVSSCKLRPYFQAHTIRVMTTFLLRQVLWKPNYFGQLLK